MKPEKGRLHRREAEKNKFCDGGGADTRGVRRKATVQQCAANGKQTFRYVSLPFT